DVQLVRRAEKQPRLGLAAGAARAVDWDAAFRMVGTVVEGGKPGAPGLKMAPQVILHLGQIRLGKVVSRNARLVGDDHQLKASLVQALDRFARAGQEADQRRVDIVGYVVDERAVFVEENGAASLVVLSRSHNLSVRIAIRSCGLAIVRGLAGS